MSALADKICFAPQFYREGHTVKELTRQADPSQRHNLYNKNQLKMQTRRGDFKKLTQ